MPTAAGSVPARVDADGTAVGTQAAAFVGFEQFTHVALQSAPAQPASQAHVPSVSQSP